MKLPWLLAAVVFSGAAADTQDVLLATRRAGRVEVFDAATLQPLGTIGVDVLAESIAASPDGRTLFLAQAMPSNRQSCCGIFALNLESNTIRFVIEPAMRAVPSPDGRFLFFNRGDVGIDVFDARTLTRRPTMKAPGVYALAPSPDGRWLMGITNWQGPSVDLFDVARNVLVRRIPAPSESMSGGWAGDRFLLYGSDGHQGSLWTLTPESVELGPAAPVALPAPISARLTAAGDHVFLYEAFGGRLDGVMGGVFEIDASTGAMLSHFASALHFGRLAASADGEQLYGIDPGPGPGWTRVRLVKVDRKTGEVVAERSLETDVWNLALARIPARLVPRGYVRPSQQEKP